MRGSTDRAPNGVERLEPTMRGRLVSHAAPDPFLGIEPQLVGWEIAQVQARMGLEELDDLIAAMPDSAIDVPPNRVAAQSPIEMPEHDQKPQPIAPRCFHQPVPTQQGATHPERLSRSRCWLVVRTRNRCPRRAQPRPPRGCKVKPVSSGNTTVSPGPSRRSFFERPVTALGLAGASLQVGVAGAFQPVAQLVEPPLGLPHFQVDPKPSPEMHDQGRPIPLRPGQAEGFRPLVQLRRQGLPDGRSQAARAPRPALGHQRQQPVGVEAMNPAGQTHPREAQDLANPPRALPFQDE